MMVIQLVAVVFRVRPKDIVGPSHKWTLTIPRWIAMALIQKGWRLGQKERGRLFNRCPSAVSYGIRKIAMLAKIYPWITRGINL